MEILITESQLNSLKRNNVKQSIDEDISAGSIVVYHRTRLSEENIKSLNSGFIPGDGQAYGRGLYSTYDLNTQLSSNMRGYGNIIVEFSITKFDKILVLNSDECKKIYGRVLSVDEQMKKILKGDYVKFIKNVPSNLKKYVPHAGINGPIANQISQIPDFQLRFDGMVFIGGNDGKVLVLFETNLANPLRYTTNDGNSWKSIKTKESLNIGKDNRGHSKLLNYLKFKRGSLDFQSFNKQTKYEIITQKIKNKIPFDSVSEYKFYIENFKPSDDEKYKIIYQLLRKDPSFLQEFDLEDEKIQLMGVQENGGAIKYIIKKGIEPSERVQLAAVQKDGNVIRFIENPSERVQLAAVQQNGNTIQFIENPSEELQLVAVQKTPNAIKYIENPSERVQLAAVEKDYYIIEYIKNPSENVQLVAVEKYGYAIKYIIDKGIEPSEKVQLVAVEKRVWPIKFIKNPSEKVQLAAVQQDGSVIEYIENPSERVQLAAVEKNGDLIKFIINKGIEPSSEVKRIARLSSEKNKSINEDVFRYDDLTDEEKNKTYEIFRDSYKNATGSSWDKIKFSSRASNWTFYGVKNKGFVVVRKQKSGMNKLTGVAGDLKSISIGIEELNKLEEPIWGMADKKIVSVLTGRYNFISPPAFIVKMLIKFIPNEVFGGTQYVINKDGSLTFNYSDVGDATKYFFGNKKYFQSLLKNVSMNSVIKFAIQKLIS